jgi:hypothetical protein
MRIVKLWDWKGEKSRLGPGNSMEEDTLCDWREMAIHLGKDDGPISFICWWDAPNVSDTHATIAGACHTTGLG